METQNSQWLPTAQVFSAELALQQGRIPEAHHRAQQAEHLPILLMHSFYVPQLTLAKVLLAQDTVVSREQADRLLTELLQFIERTHNHRYLIEVLALQAILVDAQGDQATALDKLEQAIHLAEPGGWIRLFVDLGPRLAILLNQLGRQGIAPDYIGQILAAFGNEERGARHDEPGQEKTQPPSFSFPPLVESLTDRELEVLALLAQRLSNKEIAAQLVISPGTVTQHTHNIYQKLNVDGRRQAVSKATEIGILSPLQPSHLGSVAD